ncbi:MAG: DoxX family protein [Polyangiaceae bacterium]
MTLEAASFTAAPITHGTDRASGTGGSSARVWAGRILSGLLVFFFAFDALGKLLKLAPVVSASAQLGIGEGTVFAIGLVLACCTLLYVVPRTATLGALFLTGYLGGAICTHVLHYAGAFPIVFSFGFGVLTWVGLGLRDDRVRALITRRAP